MQKLPPFGLGHHLPALDGLRGVAVLMVMFHHFTGSLISTDRLSAGLVHLGQYGMRGVDVFFVLSGFLITGILVDARDRDGYFRNFYMRRVLRIFPLYYAAIAALIGLVVLLYPPDAIERTSIIENQWWLWSYSANVFLSLQGAWSLGAANHFWSLAVEEHFYLVWPVLVWLTPARHLPWLCVGMFACAFASRGLVTAMHASEGTRLILTPCRVDGLALGGLCAVLMRRADTPRLLQVLRWLWLPTLGLLALEHVLPETSSFMDRTALNSLVVSLFTSSVLVTVVNRSRGMTGRLLSRRLLRFFGCYSYGLYVIHYPMQMAITKAGVIDAVHRLFGASSVRSLAVLTLLTAVSTVAAVLSFHLFEKHILKLKRYFEYVTPRSHEAMPVSSST